MILADENLHGKIVKALKENGVDVKRVSELNAGIPDDQVINLAKSLDAILITEDKDFGEWVFAHKVSGVTILFLRFDKSDADSMAQIVLRVLSDKTIDLVNTFVTITTSKLRVRHL